MGRGAVRQKHIRERKTETGESDGIQGGVQAGGKKEEKEMIKVKGGRTRMRLHEKNSDKDCAE